MDERPRSLRANMDAARVSWRPALGAAPRKGPDGVSPWEHDCVLTATGLEGLSFLTTRDPEVGEAVVVDVVLPGEPLPFLVWGEVVCAKPSSEDARCAGVRFRGPDGHLHEPDRGRRHQLVDALRQLGAPAPWAMWVREGSWQVADGDCEQRRCGLG